MNCSQLFCGKRLGKANSLEFIGGVLNRFTDPIVILYTDDLYKHRDYGIGKGS